MHVSLPWRYNQKVWKEGEAGVASRVTTQGYLRGGGTSYESKYLEDQ
jgi:uncharacterized membrane protein YtjA (UPF0391 family)/uncharacterized protein YjbJ (UPF0337 family)